MATIFCPGCRLEQPTAHRFCVACGEHLPVELLGTDPRKRAQWFAGVKVLDEDPDGAFLRVSCYLTEQRFEEAGRDVVVPGRTVRFSVWDGRHAKCVVSLPETEARALATFIAQELARADHRLAHEQEDRTGGR